MKFRTPTTKDKQNSIAEHETATPTLQNPAFQFVDNRPHTQIQRKLQEMANNSPQTAQFKALQRLATKQTIQREEEIDEDLLQPKFETAQREEEIDEDLLQPKFETAQRKTAPKQENKTGLPDNLKTGIENLSGYSLDDVKVHYNSDKPAQLHAHAYAQGTEIHIASGQEKHLPHEAWHVVQQKQGRVKPTMQLKGNVNVNDEAGLEKEADVMGGKALQLKPEKNKNKVIDNSVTRKRRKSDTILQGYFTYKGIELNEKTAESVHGWAHFNLLDLDLKKNFFKKYNDKINATDIELWFSSNNLILNESVFKHLTHFDMSELQLTKNELIFEMKNMYQDTYQSIDDILGADKLMCDIATVDISKTTAFAFLQGYRFQVKTLIDYVNKSKFIESDGMDEFKPKVKAVETQYQDYKGVSRWADMEINDSDDESSSYIEVKAMSPDYNPNEQTKIKFEEQAIAYSKCGKKVMYLFKNQPPDWVKLILEKYKLEFKIG